MDPLLKDWLTIGFSSIALIISCASFFLSWRNFHRDASRLQIHMDFEVIPGHGSSYLLHITNVGRRPCTISKIYACVKGKQRYPVFETQTTLKETESKDVTVPMFSLPMMKHPLQVKVFEVEDSTGKRYKAHTSQLAGFIRKYWKPEIDGLHSAHHSS